jgi:oligopeptidase A
LRHEAARLLGYAHFAEVSLVPKMATSVDEVLGFLRDLVRRARPFALRDYAELQAFGRTELGLAELAPWDLAYASEKLKAKRFAFSEQEVRCYFPEHKVLAGLFQVVETLYGISIRESLAPKWQDDVRFFDVNDVSGAPIGQFYLDNYARPGKQGGAWQDDAVNRRRAGAEVQHPVCFITCNLSASSDGGPATFTHDEVITLFHEFGHGLHQLLTRVDVAGVSGIQGVEWDAVELPSQLMENFCWEWEVLAQMTAHVDTGEPLPRAVRPDARGEEFSERPGNGPLSRVRPVRHAAALGPRPSRRRAAAGRARCGAARSRGGAPGFVRPLHALVRAHLRRRLRSWILQLSMGRGALRGRVFRIRGSRRAITRRGSEIP